MTLRVRIPSALLARVREDLERPHPFAAERVGFLTTSLKQYDDEVLLIVTDYHSVADEDYIEDPTVGARIGERVIDAAITRAADDGQGVFHVHAHFGSGLPRLSRTDRRELPGLVRPLRIVGKQQAHGIFLLSDDAATAWAWLPGGSEAVVPDMVSIVGRPMSFIPRDGWPNVQDSEQHARQSFLGEHAQDILKTARVGIVGLGGGGSHINQQLSHIGVRHVVAFDGDRTELSNLNRNVGSSLKDAMNETPKLGIARRIHEELVLDSAFVGHAGRWQERPDLLEQCDLVFGCLDTFDGRRELEATCRRYLIPYIDIGMDVHCVSGEPPRMAGQVILSTPGHPCMACIDYLNEETLAQEAALYGDVGGLPQVVWANGVLASAAVGIGVDVLTGWSGRSAPVEYLSFDGNCSTLTEHPVLRYPLPSECQHYMMQQAGPPIWRAA